MAEHELKVFVPVEEEEEEEEEDEEEKEEEDPGKRIRLTELSIY